MSSYTIAFDVPASEGPTFPERIFVATPCMVTPSLEFAAQWSKEGDAERFLASDDVPESLRQWGVVVEVDQP